MSAAAVADGGAASPGPEPAGPVQLAPCLAEEVRWPPIAHYNMSVVFRSGSGHAGREGSGFEPAEGRKVPGLKYLARGIPLTRSLRGRCDADRFKAAGW